MEGYGGLTDTCMPAPRELGSKLKDLLERKGSRAGRRGNSQGEVSSRAERGIWPGFLERRARSLAALGMTLARVPPRSASYGHACPDLLHRRHGPRAARGRQQ